MQKKSPLIASISLKDIESPKPLIVQDIRINGLGLKIARPADSKRLPAKFKSLF